MKPNYEDPVETPNDSPMGGTILKHPAYAVIRATRVQGGRGVLFQSPFRHNNTMRIAIAPADVTRTLSNDWVHGSVQEYIEVEMSESQWATFISTPNSGTGTPCTLQHRDREAVPQIREPVDKSKQFADEVTKTMVEGQAHLDLLRAAVEGLGLSEKKKKEMLWHVEKAQRSIGSSLKFTAEQFVEHMDKVSNDAKTEVAAYMDGYIARAGIKALRGAKPLLLEAEPTLAIEDATVESLYHCPSCDSHGFAPSTVSGQCTFCDGTEGGNSPQSIAKS